jgi:hypothetical protein
VLEESKVDVKRQQRFIIGPIIEASSENVTKVSKDQYWLGELKVFLNRINDWTL